jgi:hypothetical protein
MKLKSYLLLFVLIVILFFILGVRYGQKVEKTNKTINYLLSITPTKTPTPSPTPYEIITQKSKKYGIKYNFPSFLELFEDPTSAAVFLKTKK